MASKLSEKLCFAWSGDYESRKHFVKDDLKLEGVRSQPGGDKKLFTFDDTSTLWKNVRISYALVVLERTRSCKSRID